MGSLDIRLDKLLLNGSVSAAKGLLGADFYVIESDGTKVGGRIIETEAYSQEDAASHSYKGKTPRTEVMFGPAGHLYVYFTYGMHWCVNVVTGAKGYGEAVLIRAIDPLYGIERIRERRNNRPDSELTNGPAKICQALQITGADNGASIAGPRVHLGLPKEPLAHTATPRIGISQDKHRLWRFVV